ncbi:MAG: thiamine-phosphate kinase [Gemmatimonadota bacterium]
MDTETGLGLAPGPESLWIGTLLDGVGAGVGTDRPRATSVRLDVPPGDDAAAFVVPEGSRLVVSSDASVEGIHFRREWMTWEIVGYRAAASALSDLAAMAAEPIGLTLSLALPPELDANAVSAIGRGVGEALRYTGGTILGGDLVASPGPVMLDVTVLGHTPRPVTRSGAGVGEEVWITGSLGGAAAAVADLQAGLEPTPEARAAFEHPRPRVAEALWLAERVEPTALIDVSDGLGRDGRHLATSSSVRLDVALEDLPAHPSLEPYLESDAGVRLLLAGGEDYELLFTAPPGRVTPVLAEFSTRFGIDLTRIGFTSHGRSLRVTREDDGGGEADVGGETDTDGFDHFGEATS